MLLAPIEAGAQTVYVASSGTDTVTAVDAGTMTIRGTPVPVGADPTSVAVTPDGNVVIATVLAHKDGERVVVIDAVRNRRQRFWKPFGPPAAVVIEPTPRSQDRRLAEVLVRTGTFGPGISFFNLKRMAWIHFTRARKNSDLIALTPDGSRIYVAGTDRKTAKAFVSEFHFFFMSGQSHTGLRTDFDLAGGTTSALAVTPDSRFVIVATQDASGGFVNVLDRANNNQVSSQNIGAVVIPRNLAVGSNAGGTFGLLTTNQELVLLSASGLPARIASNSSVFPGSFSPDKVAITPNGNVAYLTDGTQPFVARLDVSGRGGFGRVQMLKLPSATTPGGLAVSPDGNFAFVAQGGAGTGVVSRIDVNTNAVTTVPVEGQPVALAIGPSLPAIGGGNNGGGGNSGGTGPTNCSGNLQPCGQTCVDLEADPANCGACANVCATGDVCTRRRCVCPDGRQICGAKCADLATDTANCGGCGSACGAGQACVSGRCACPAGAEVCGGRCVNLGTNPKNCGRCGVACAAGEVCSVGGCVCPAGHAVCNGACVSLDADPKNCGKCGRACIPGDVCSAGTCVCPAGRSECSGECVNTDVSLTNCGTCGRVCLPGESCVVGSCTCPDGHKLCRDVCIDISADPNNCGECRRVCAPGQRCVAGRCG